MHALAVKSRALDEAHDVRQVRRLKESMLAPLKRKDGVAPRELISRIQDLVAPVDLSVIKTGSRMKLALDEIVSLRAEAERLQARDPHELGRCIDAESMLLCAEIFYRASLRRTESRGFHYREDFPATDNGVWLKWVIVKDHCGGMQVSLEDIPMERYPYQPRG